jgi:beta-glucosidase
MASFGPEPYLTGMVTSQAVSGASAGRAITHGKHFLLNEQETNRSSSSAYSSNADDKTVHELYMWPFADGIRAGLGAVMCAMNRYAFWSYAFSFIPPLRWQGNSQLI